MQLGGRACGPSPEELSTSSTQKSAVPGARFPKGRLEASWRGEAALGPPGSRLVGRPARCAAATGTTAPAPGRTASIQQLSRQHLEASFGLDGCQAVPWGPQALSKSCWPLSQLSAWQGLAVRLDEPPIIRPGRLGDGRRPGGPDKNDDFYANVGDAIRTLREEIPQLFQRDLSYGIYTEGITFKDPRNEFKGKKNYRTIFWSLRFHGALFFRHLYVDVLRIWQPEEKLIKMRWTVRGIPRVPWEAEGTFDGISTYRLDCHGKIWEHQVDNVILRDPPMARSPLFAGLNLLPVPGVAQQPVPGAYFSDACVQEAADGCNCLQPGQPPSCACNDMEDGEALVLPGNMGLSQWPEVGARAGHWAQCKARAAPLLAGGGRYCAALLQRVPVAAAGDEERLYS